ncbi:hypothetical protein T4E_3531 [Trichinella pseudospiralis]|uniref:Uncharacterized protein n=1 Tax=Trichinella pseudospiralis TaxID=6337 RepID=A0A0V0WIE4_TRIPS|nr:hypothetical protein T4E_3531 [Trichinella pseudospiralis]
MEDKDYNFESKDYPSINLKINEYYPPSVTVLVNTFPGKLQTLRILSPIETSDFN